MRERLPPWFKKRIHHADIVTEMRDLIGDLELNTICESAICPNQGDCYAKRTATFLILGNVCTRNCTFCAVNKGRPAPLDGGEPDRIGEAVARMGLRHVVITSVTRDDLPDGGAGHFARVIRTLKGQDEGLTVEVLIPDFQGDRAALAEVAAARPDVLNHNVETVPRLYPAVRPMADFRRSVELLRAAKDMDSSLVTKSGIMVGLGEEAEELRETMADLRAARCDLLTIGQYLQPSPAHHEVVRYVPPEEFDGYARDGRAMGFADVAAAPFVRSSFSAAELFHRVK